jgi:hypothetical protein
MSLSHDEIIKKLLCYLNWDRDYDNFYGFNYCEMFIKWAIRNNFSEQDSIEAWKIFHEGINLY